IPPPPPNNGYSGDSPAIRAAASVIAELGPWDVTMEKVADKLGLSKSSLYSHFQNKNDMIIKVFLNEFEKMTLFAAAAAYQSNKNEELLYSAFFSIAQYFRQNPDILNALSHLKTRRPYKEAGMEEYESLHDCEKHKSKHFDFSVIFRHIKDDKQNPIISETAAEWMFFILIHTFMHYHDTIMFKDIPNEYFRIVYRYIALGIE
ncbi:MAG: TetR/AcrR family transcriptional regulator, partial [Spirochaetaceae bacterium]|nr:TetR/AcrR family transcriptional regulator [Spirochaetaceae bacterium]